MSRPEYTEYHRRKGKQFTRTAIMVSASVATAFLGFFTERYVTDWLPEQPNIWVWLGLAASIIVLFLHIFWNQLFERDKRWERDWRAWDVWRYLYDWTELRRSDLEGIEWEVSQAIQDGDVQVQARCGNGSLIDTVTPDDFKGNELHLVFTRSKQIPGLRVKIPTWESTIRSRSKRGQPVGADEWQEVWFFGREVKSRWPRKYWRTIWHRVRERVKGETGPS